MSILVLADIDGDNLSSSTARVVSAARQIGGDIHVLVSGRGGQSVAAAAAAIEGVAKVLHADDASLDHQLAEPLGALIVALAGAYDSIMATANSMGKNVMPRVAALLDVMQVSEITAVKAPDTFERPIYAGNAIETVQALDAKKVLTVRASSFEAAGGGGAASIELVQVLAGTVTSVFVSEQGPTSDRPDLGSAEIVVSGGRALGSREQFDALIVPLAAKLKAAVGASRAAVDAGYVSNNSQVGQTGKVVAPKLYVACGISGAIQHLAGMKDSKIIVAINKDADAPIFQLADYGLVADLFEALPELTSKL